MAKAIKHIKAGELHIEVIGQIPDQEHKRRSARTRRTSPAQAFYNNKCSWQELELVIATNFTNDDWVVTYTYDNDHLPKDKQAAQKELQKHFRKVRTIRRLRGADLLYAYTTEGYHRKSAVDFLGEDGYLEDGRLHACGTHEQLLRTDAIYQEIYHSQMKGGDGDGAPAGR